MPSRAVVETDQKPTHADNTGDNKSETALAAPKPGLWLPAPTEKVLAKWGDGNYYLATTKSLEQMVVIVWDDGGSETQLRLADVLPNPVGDKPPQAFVGDMVLVQTAETSGRWTGATVTETGEDAWKVLLVTDGKEMQLPPSRIIAVSETISEELRIKNAETKFLLTAKSKSPVIPDDFEPKPEVLVIAQWSENNWWEGKIDKLENDKALVTWTSGFAPSEVNLDSLIPLPSEGAKSTAVVDQFVLYKPEYGNEWLFGQAVTAGESELTVRDKTGKEITLPSHRWTPLK